MKRGAGLKKVLLLSTVVILLAFGAYFLYTFKGIPKWCAEADNDYYFYSKALLNNDSGFCSKIGEEKKPLCIARITKDESVCETALEGWKETCKAVATNDMSLCPETDPDCRIFLGDSESCKLMGANAFSCEAAIKGDISYFESEKAKSDCKDAGIANRAVSKQDISLCEKIQNSVMKENCKSTVNLYLAVG